MLYLIGLGFQLKDISLRAVEAIKKCDEVYLENYTNKLQYDIRELDNLLGIKIKLADRDFVENSGYLEKESKEKNIALLIAGDPLSATTHIDIVMRAKSIGSKVEIINNISIFNIISQTGLQLYKFGKTTSIPYPENNFSPTNFYDVLEENMSINAHTLMLLDLKPEHNKFMSIKEAIQLLLKAENKKKKGIFSLQTKCVACSQLGTKHQTIAYGSAEKLMKKEFPQPCCLIIPAKLHFMEEGYLKEFNIA